MAIENFTVAGSELMFGSVRLARVGAHVPFDANNDTASDSLAVTEFEFERDFAVNPGSEFFDSVLADNADANALTASFELSIQDGTVESWSIEEGTAVGWSLSQSAATNALERLLVLARVTSTDVNGGGAELRYGPPQAAG
ncbi:MULTISPECIES: hypothetical protein [unclassified Rhizobium]|uniref:hypothetical protein n=1 Tax=unclassified Rhizobium TaxID=2613769 RepID=UPI0007EB1B42|nr:MULTISPECIES: hypothetical protein [unclassified Rhizobium]ANM09242.1 hypothetical protein AMK05_CH00813 [Rhizobium sp. N324]OYD02810.1 hypothetical protein AMK08_CH100809 [Rhizobium sp. N4311]